MLCTSIVVLFFVRLLYPYFVVSEQANVSWIDFTDDRNQLAKPHSEDAVSATIQKGYRPFNPNSDDLSKLLAAGFTPKLAKTLVTFRKKGFVVRQQTDLKKVYGISDDVYQAMEPFIKLDLPATQIPKPLPEPKAVNILELNAADSLDLLALPGIGPALTKRIIQFRLKLGGFYSVKQLSEVYGLPTETYDLLLNKVRVDSNLIVKIRPNIDDFKQLAQHPYIGYELSKKLCNVRKNDLLNEERIKALMANDEQFARLKPYLFFAR